MRLWLLLQQPKAHRAARAATRAQRRRAPRPGDGKVGLELLLNNTFLLLNQLPEFRVEICKIWPDFLQILQISEIFADFFEDHLWFPAIPTKFREDLDEKSPILANFSNILQESRKFAEILQIFAKNLNILNLERCKGLHIL